jgi:phosphonate transport system substrate-binding protein
MVMLMPTTIRLSYYPWITQNITPQDLDRHIKRFATTLQDQLRLAGDPTVSVEVLPPLDVPAQIAQLVAGGADLALMNPLGYVFARRRDSTIQSIAVAQRVIDGKIGSVYYAQVYTHKKTAITNLAQAKGRTLAFGAKFSTSNFLIPAYELRSKGLHPLTAFASVAYLGGHDKVARAVYEGKVDLGAGHDGVISDLGNQYGYGDARECLVQLLRSTPIPSDPIALRTQDPKAVKSIADALVAASRLPDGKDALAKFWGGVVGLEVTTPSAYDSLSAALGDFNLSDADLLT